MSQLRISLFGSLQVTLDGKPVSRFSTKKVSALLAYLAIENHSPHERTFLAGLLWPEILDETARGSLRAALFNLRKVLGDTKISLPFFLVNRQTIQLNPDADVVIDVVNFEELAAQSYTNPTLAREAVALYKGDFLAEFSLSDCPEFEQWVLLHREMYQRKAIELLMDLGNEASQNTHYSDAIDYMDRLVHLAPWHEDAHRNLIYYLWQNGQTEKAIRHYTICTEMLAAELDVEPAPETVALYQRICAERDVITAEIHIEPISTSLRDNLPVDATPFVGRQAEIEKLEELLSEPGCRLLTLTGLGGIGKTRLSQALARHILYKAEQNRYRDGVWFVSFVGSDSLTTTLMNALNLQFEKGDIKQHLSHYLSNKQMLLILDNLEHLVSQLSWISDLLSNASQIQILATSRTQLGLYEEWSYDVWGMGISAEDKVAQPSTTSEVDDATQLFEQAARRADARFELTGTDLNYVTSICRLVGGHPLSIELAAAWIRLFSCQEIAQEIASGMELLTSTQQFSAQQTREERHRSLNLIFEHTWQMLEPAEQAAMDKLSIFCNPFSPDAARQISDVSMPMLLQLSRRSLIQRRNNGFMLHPAIRQYAIARLSRASDIQNGLYTQHSRYHLDYIEQQHTAMYGKNQPDVLKAISQLLDDIHQAWDWALEHQQVDAVVRSIPPLFFFYNTRSWYQPGEFLFREAVDVVTNWPSDLDSIKTRVIARLQSRQATFRYRLGAITEAREQLVSCISTLKTEKDTKEEVFALLMLANVYYDLGDYAKAEEMGQQALRLSRQLGDPYGIADGLRLLADLQFYVEGNFQVAFSLYESSLAAARENGNWPNMILALINQGSLFISTGEHHRAEAVLREGLEMSRAIDSKRCIGVSLTNLAVIAAEEQELEKAQMLYSENYKLRQEIGDKLGQATCLRNMAYLAIARETYPEAHHLVEQAHELYDSLQNFRGIVDTLSIQAEIEIRGQRYAEASDLLARAWGLASDLQTLPALVGMIPYVALLAIKTGHTEDAVHFVGFVLQHPAAPEYQRKEAQRVLTAAPAIDQDRLHAMLMAGADYTLEQVEDWLTTVNTSLNPLCSTDHTVADISSIYVTSERPSRSYKVHNEERDIQMDINQPYDTTGAFDTPFYPKK